MDYPRKFTGGPDGSFDSFNAQWSDAMRSFRHNYRRESLAQDQPRPPLANSEPAPNLTSSSLYGFVLNPV